MGKLYVGTSKEQYEIIEPELASGGEGIVYEVVGKKDYVLKIFKEHCRTPQREAKLLRMTQLKMTEFELEQIIWPLDVVYDEKGFAGYLMPKIRDNKNLNVIYSTKNQLDLRHRMVIAYNLCAAIDVVHSKGQVCGDMNPQNILVNTDLASPNALHVTLVDTDSFHIQDEDKVYRCEVGLATYLAPEIQKKMSNGATLRNAPLPTYTRETDLFALAVHVFCLLMNGCHPFACAKKTNSGYQNDMEPMSNREEESIVLPQPIENIRDGFFPFLQEKKGMTFPLYAPNMKDLPIPIQQMFIRAFESGYFAPTERPSAEEWMAVLERYHAPAQYRTCDKKHYYIFEGSESCPYCKANLRMMQMMQNMKREEFGSENVIANEKVEQTGNSGKLNGTTSAINIKGIKSQQKSSTSINNSMNVRKNSKQAGTGNQQPPHTSSVKQNKKNEGWSEKKAVSEITGFLASFCFASFLLVIGAFEDDSSAIWSAVANVAEVLVWIIIYFNNLKPSKLTSNEKVMAPWILGLFCSTIFFIISILPYIWYLL